MLVYLHLLGARVYFVVFNNWDYYKANPMKSLILEKVVLLFMVHIITSIIVAIIYT